MTKKERRGAVRTPAKLAMQIQLSGHDLAHTESINVSANGVYFSSPQFIPTLTRLAITLVLPGDKGRRHEVVCEGVVVRTEPEAPSDASSYQVACAFTSISRSDQERLESYILAQLAF